VSYEPNPIYSELKTPLRPVAVQFVLGYFPIQSITMDSQNLRGLGLVTAGFGEGVLDESLFEFIHGFIQVNPALDHLSDEGFQLLFHNFFLVGVDYFFYFRRHQRSNAR
jgi:hypothetical protein